MLIRVKETVIQAALNALDDDEVLEVEATRCAAHDVVVAQPAAGDVETRAALLLSTGEGETSREGRSAMRMKISTVRL